MALKTETSHWLYVRLILVGVMLAFVWLLLGFPLAQVAVHGWDPSAWPPAAIRPTEWFTIVLSFDLVTVIQTVLLSIAGRHPALLGTGIWVSVLLAASWMLTTVVIATPKPDPNWRNPETIFGGARFATSKEVASMQRGFEIGYTGDTRQLVRVEIEGNLISIAPPRSGKTSGLIINNLLAPDAHASWSGPAVVIDPKGEVYAAVAKRRKALGRDVYAFDLRRGSGKQRRNPMDYLHPGDTLGLARAARALIPEMTGESAYFRERAVSFLSGIFAAALLEAEAEGRSATPGDVEALLNDEVAALALAEAHPGNALLRALATDLRLDERIRGSIISTAKMGIQWLLDDYLRALTSKTSLDLHAVAKGNADLFIIVPTEHFQTVAPLLRWLLSDLFTAVRRVRQPDHPRLTLFIDEAASLGGFEQLPVALGELPGLGLSIWTFWQSRAQIIEHYGEAGADIFGSTAEFSTFSDVGGLETSSADFFSRLLGDTTVDVPSESRQRQDNRTSSTESAGKQGTRLVTAGDLPAFTADRLVLVASSRRYAKHPVQLEKVRYYEEARFRKLFAPVPPAGLSG